MDKLIDEFEFANIGRHKVVSRIGLHYGLPIIRNLTENNDLMWYVGVAGGYPMSKFPVGHISEHRFCTWLKPEQTRIYVTGEGQNWPSNTIIEKDLDQMVKQILAISDRQNFCATNEQYKEATSEGPVKQWIATLNSAILVGQQWYEEGAMLTSDQKKSLEKWHKHLEETRDYTGKESFLGVWHETCSDRQLKVQEA